MAERRKIYEVWDEEIKESIPVFREVCEIEGCERLAYFQVSNKKTVIRLCGKHYVREGKE